MTDFRLSELDRLSSIDQQELVLHLPVDLIDPDPEQPRSTFSEDGLRELAANLRALGQIQPIEVRANGERYTLIDGERRWRAAKLVPLTALRAVLRFAPDTPDDVLDRQFATNHQREAMTLADQARYLQKRLDQLGSAAAVSEVIGVSATRILNIVKTLHADGAAAELRDSGITRDADTIGAVIEVQRRDPAAAQALVAAAKANGKLPRKDAQDAARAAKGNDPASRDFAEGRGSGRKPRVPEPKLVVRLACEGAEAQRAHWNKLSRLHGRACLSLVATTDRPGCVLVEFGLHSEPFPAQALRILDAAFETEKST